MSVIKKRLLQKLGSESQNFAGLITPTKSFQKNFQCYFRDQLDFEEFLSNSVDMVKNLPFELPFLS